ncbi:diguanylate cyclase (GGDEF) domain-containing protein [Oscillospiraceae bacterium]|nr:diguanylate cyclase (GGDEF) domain-containing protein [Oscillospiraceae bacterium]
MDFERLLSGYRSKTCIMSVERFPDGKYGNIRIVAGNKAHCDDMANVMHNPFVPDSPYEKYFPQNRNFEDYCYRCSFMGQPLHTYVSLPQMGLWLNMFLLPLESDREDIGYCIYIYDVTPEVDTQQRASLSADTSATVLETCIKLRGSDDIPATFAEVVDDIRKICDSEHCCILVTDKESQKCINLAESLKPDCGLLPMDTYLDKGFYDVAMTWDKTIGDSTCVIIKDENDMEWLKETNPVWYESLRGAMVRNVVLFPLNHNGETLGYMWSINFNVDNTVKIKETLELTTFFIASEISNYHLLQRLQVLSTMDVLTGVMNRNAMNTRVDEIVDGTVKIPHPSSVLFADLNGLKRMNDEQGHSSGDNLLKTAAAILRGVFFDSDVYRAGGDEFLVIAPGIGEEELETRISKLMEQSEASRIVHFAIGRCILNDGDDIRDAMRLADERMYLDKKAYYEKHPERKYR